MYPVSPHTQHSEGSVLHAQSKLGSIVVEGNAAHRFLHVTASEERVVKKAPQPDRQTDDDSADKDTRSGGAHDVLNQPHRTVVTAGDSNRLFGVQR